jgi:hypothetical protein
LLDLSNLKRGVGMTDWLEAAAAVFSGIITVAATIEAIGG